ncbi:MAG: hypothetical protein ABW166_04695 [Sedimenticola sp.]
MKKLFLIPIILIIASCNVNYKPTENIENNENNENNYVKVCNKVNELKAKHENGLAISTTPEKKSEHIKNLITVMRVHDFLECDEVLGKMF